MLFSGILCVLSGVINLAFGQNNFNFVIGGMCLGVGMMNIIAHCVKNR